MQSLERSCIKNQGRFIVSLPFSYQTIGIELDSKFKAITLKFGQDKSLFISSKMIQELENFFSWICTHSEINAIVLQSYNKTLLQGFDPTELETLSQEDFILLTKKFQNLIYAMPFLPQTIIVDVQEGVSGAGVELLAAADIRIARDSAHVHFDHLQNGQLPVCGGIGLLQTVIPQYQIRHWLLAGQPIPADDLKQNGLFHSIYDEDSTKIVIEGYLQEIFKQSPVARIQAKRALLEILIPQMEKGKELESRIGHAGLVTGDWKESAKSSNEGRGPKFLTTKEMSQILKRASAATL